VLTDNKWRRADLQPVAIYLNLRAFLPPSAYIDGASYVDVQLGYFLYGVFSFDSEPKLLHQLPLATTWHWYRSPVMALCEYLKVNFNTGHGLDPVTGSNTGNKLAVFPRDPGMVSLKFMSRNTPANAVDVVTDVVVRELLDKAKRSSMNFSSRAKMIMDRLIDQPFDVVCPVHCDDNSTAHGSHGTKCYRITVRQDNSTFHLDLTRVDGGVSKGNNKTTAIPRYTADGRRITRTEHYVLRDIPIPTFMENELRKGKKKKKRTTEWRLVANSSRAMKSAFETGVMSSTGDGAASDSLDLVAPSSALAITVSFVSTSNGAGSSAKDLSAAQALRGRRCESDAALYTTLAEAEIFECEFNRSEVQSTDHAKLGNFLAEYGLELRPTLRDGNCLFHVFCQILGLPCTDAGLVRSSACDFLRRNSDLLLGASDDYVEQMALNGVWGGHREIFALCRHYSLNVMVFFVSGHGHQAQLRSVCEFGDPNDTSFFDGYIAYVDGTHFEYAVPARA